MYPGKLGGLSASFTRRIWLLFKLVSELVDTTWVLFYAISFGSILKFALRDVVANLARLYLKRLRAAPIVNHTPRCGYHVAAAYLTNSEHSASENEGGSPDALSNGLSETQQHKITQS